MSENINYEEKNINNNPEYKQVSDPFEEKFFDSIRKGQFITKREEHIFDKDEGEKRAFVIAKKIMSKATKPEKDRAFNYKYANIERLNDCISLETEKFNEELKKSNSGEEVILEFTADVNMLGNTDCVIIVRNTCILLNDKYRLLSEYVVNQEILMQDMFPDFKCKDSAKCDDFIKYKGKCITYAKRYALLQFMMPSRLGEDPEESDKIQNNRTISKHRKVVTNNRDWDED